MNVAKEITHAAAQSMHKYVWHVKWDQREEKWAIVETERTASWSQIMFDVRTTYTLAHM